MPAGVSLIQVDTTTDNQSSSAWWLARDLRVLLAGWIVLTGSLFFWWLMGQVRSGATDEFDHFLIQSLRNHANPVDAVGPPWLEEAARDITGLGGYAVLTCLTLAVIAFRGLYGKHLSNCLLSGSIVGGAVVMHFLKAWIGRPRPALIPHLSYAVWASFPSGHAMLSAVVYLGLGLILVRLVDSRLVKLFFLALALTLTFLIGISRIYLGVHYPTDVLAGWAAGLSWASLYWLVTRALQPGGSVELDRRE